MEAGTFGALRTSRALAIGTSVRIAASPVILALLLGHDWTVAAILFLVAAATDFIDGRLARRWEVTTKLGSFLDTTADKLLVSTALLGLLAVDRVSPWVTFVIISREFTILGLRAAVSAGGSQFETSKFGKWKATLQFVAIALAMIRPDVIIARRLPRSVADDPDRRDHRLVGYRLPDPLCRRAEVLTGHRRGALMAKVFLSGGTGLIGSALMTALLERGDQVVALARSDAAASALADRGVEVHRGELQDEQALAAAMDGCEIAFNVAGLNKFCVTRCGADDGSQRRRRCGGRAGGQAGRRSAPGPHLLGRDAGRGAGRGRQRVDAAVAAGISPTTRRARRSASVPRWTLRPRSARTSST